MWRGWTDRWRSVAAVMAAMAASCAPASSPAPTFNADRAANVVIGRSSRADVFAVLGRPVRTEQSRAGETWVYEARPDSRGAALSGTAGAALGIAGAFVPYVGLVGPGLTLAGTARSAGQPDPALTSLSVSFGADGLVRDCLFSTTAPPAGLPGAAPNSAKAMGCQRGTPG